MATVQQNNVPSVEKGLNVDHFNFNLNISKYRKLNVITSYLGTLLNYIHSKVLVLKNSPFYISFFFESNLNQLCPDCFSLQ